MESTDVPGYLHPVQAVFLAMLPLAVMDALSSRAANVVSERRARRARRVEAARPRVSFLFVALGWALAAGAAALLAWAAGARPTGPGVGEDWVATGLTWATVICACAAVMTVGRAIPPGAVRRQAWLAAGVGPTGVAGDVASAGGVTVASDVFGSGRAGGAGRGAAG
jgi:hypothetical protein